MLLPHLLVQQDHLSNEIKHCKQQYFVGIKSLNKRLPEISHIRKLAVAKILLEWLDSIA